MANLNDQDELYFGLSCFKNNSISVYESRSNLITKFLSAHNHLAEFIDRNNVVKTPVNIDSLHDSLQGHPDPTYGLLPQTRGSPCVQPDLKEEPPSYPHPPPFPRKPDRRGISQLKMADSGQLKVRA